MDINDKKVQEVLKVISESRKGLTIGGVFNLLPNIPFGSVKEFIGLLTFHNYLSYQVEGGLTIYTVTTKAVTKRKKVEAIDPIVVGTGGPVKMPDSLLDPTTAKTTSDYNDRVEQFIVMILVDTKMSSMSRQDIQDVLKNKRGIELTKHQVRHRIDNLEKLNHLCKVKIGSSVEYKFNKSGKPCEKIKESVKKPRKKKVKSVVQAIAELEPPDDVTKRMLGTAKKAKGVMQTVAEHDHPKANDILSPSQVNSFMHGVGEFEFKPGRFYELSYGHHGSGMTLTVFCIENLDLVIMSTGALITDGALTNVAGITPLTDVKITGKVQRVEEVSLKL